MNTTWIPGPKFWAAFLATLGAVAGLYTDQKWAVVVSAATGTLLVYLFPHNGKPTEKE